MTYRFKRAGLVDLVDHAKKRIPSVSAGVWVPQAFMEGNRDAVQKVVDALIEGIEREKSDRAFAESEIRKYLGVTDQAELDFTYDFYVNGPIAVGPMPQSAQIESNIKALSAGNPRLAGVDVPAMIDQSFVKGAQKAASAQTNKTSGSGASPLPH